MAFKPWDVNFILTSCSDPTRKRWLLYAVVIKGPSLRAEIKEDRGSVYSTGDHRDCFFHVFLMQLSKLCFPWTSCGNSLLILWSQRLSLLLHVWCTTRWLGCLGENAVVGIRQYFTCTYPWFLPWLSPQEVPVCLRDCFTVHAFCIYAAFMLLFAAALLHWLTPRTAVLGQSKNAAHAVPCPCRPCLGRNAQVSI